MGARVFCCPILTLEQALPITPDNPASQSAGTSTSQRAPSGTAAGNGGDTRTRSRAKGGTAHGALLGSAHVCATKTAHQTCSQQADSYFLIHTQSFFTWFLA